MVVAVISVEVVVEAVIHAVTTRRVDAHVTIAGSHTMTAVVAVRARLLVLYLCLLMDQWPSI